MIRDRKTSPQTRRLLAALLAERLAWRHGYELSKATALKAGTLYPILARLRGRGLLESRWEPSAQPGRPPRHAYRLTAGGVALAQTPASGASAPGLPADARSGS